MPLNTSSKHSNKNFNKFNKICLCYVVKITIDSFFDHVLLDIVSWRKKLWSLTYEQAIMAEGKDVALAIGLTKMSTENMWV